MKVENEIININFFFKDFGSEEEERIEVEGNVGMVRGSGVCVYFCLYLRRKRF